uniref:Uncharacterized protein n=1 Tax=Anopheles dirus TaxID=7168 RepID=A0A182NWG5_9DIPT
MLSNSVGEEGRASFRCGPRWLKPPMPPIMASRGGGGGPRAPGPIPRPRLLLLLSVRWARLLPAGPCWLYWSGASVRKLDGTSPRTPSSSPM